MLAGVASVAGRAAIHAVRVQIVPAPRCHVDSREILRILQSYGDITTYRWLKHDALSSAPNSAMAIFAESDAMNRFLHECPLTFEIDRTEHQDGEEQSPAWDDGAPDEEAEFDPVATTSSTGDGNELSRTRNSLTDNVTDASARKQRKAGTKPIAQKPAFNTRPQLFRLNADLWRGRHRDWLERHPFWGNFQPNRKTIPSADLSKRVPLVGLSDLDVNSRPEIPIRILNKRKEAQNRRPAVREMIKDLRGTEGEPHTRIETG